MTQLMLHSYKGMQNWKTDMRVKVGHNGMMAHDMVPSLLGAQVTD
jgi:hypothetical protein